MFVSAETSLHFTSLHFTSLRSVLILTSNLRLGVKSDYFPSGFLTEILYEFINFSMLAVCPAHLIFSDLLILTKSVKRINYEARHHSLLLPPSISSL